MEQRVQAVSALGQKQCVSTDIRSCVRRSRLRVCAYRWHHRQRSPEGERRKRGTQNQAIGRSKGGLTTKVLALTDALGNLVRFKLLPGQRSEIVGVPELIQGLAFDAMLADKAFDADHLRQTLAKLDAEAVIPAKKNRTIHIPHDKTAYKWRHLIENYFSKIKEFRGVNTRYDKTDASYQASWHIAPTIIALR
jgi:transposase